MSTKSSLSLWTAALRVYQWPKNLVVFAALVFGEQLLYSQQVARSVAAFLAFCGASSGVYLFNDLRDRLQDAAHPVKRLRPVASGAISPPSAAGVSALLLAGSLVAAFLLGPAFGVAMASYIVLMAAYTILLKHLLVVDVLTISAGFVVRAVAGAVALGVVFTNWLVVCTFFLALFLSLAKRRRELELLDSDAARHRAVHESYSVAYLDTLILLAAGSALLSYVIYTCSDAVLERFGTDKLYLTVPFVAYGLFRYLFLVHHSLSGEDPSRTLLQDKPLIAAIALWGLSSVAVIYGRAYLGA